MLEIYSETHGRLLFEKINSVFSGSRAEMKKESRTGLFYRKSSKDYVLLWQNREIACYQDVDEFVRAHMQGLTELESRQAELLESQYKSLPQ